MFICFHKKNIKSVNQQKIRKLPLYIFVAVEGFSHLNSKCNYLLTDYLEIAK